jgi:hypothetical protein
LRADDDWTIVRGTVVSSGGPDVGSNSSAMPLFSVLADVVAASETGDPMYPEEFTTRAEGLIRRTLSVDEMFAIMRALSAFAPVIQSFQDTVTMGRNGGVPEEDIRRELANTLVGIVGIDACLAVPRDRFASLYPE